MIEKIDLKLGTFDGEEDKQKAIVELQTLLAQPGWKFVVKTLVSNISRYQEIINDEETPDDERRVYIKALHVLKKLAVLPKNQIAALKGRPEVEWNPDPFYTSVDELTSGDHSQSA